MNHAVQRRAPRVALVAGTAAAFAIGLGAPAMAASSASVANDTLTIRGTSGSDRIVLRLALGAREPSRSTSAMTGPPSTASTAARSARSRSSPTAGVTSSASTRSNGVFADEAITVNGGSGNDTLDGGDGVETFLGGSGNDAVDGNRGDDTGVLGSGNDSFRWDPGDGSDVVEGQSGTDTLDFNGANVAEIMSLSAEGERSIFLRNVANIRMDMDGVERLDLTALGGVDTMTVNDMSGTDFRVADVDLSAPTGGGDGAADIVTVNGTQNADHVRGHGCRRPRRGVGTQGRDAGSSAASPPTNCRSTPWTATTRSTSTPLLRHSSRWP